MSIPSQLPPIPLPQGEGVHKVLVQAVGQTVEAEVLGQQQPSGITQVRIAGQVMNLQVPLTVTKGTSLSLEVQQGEGQLTLRLLSATAPQSGQVSPSQTNPAPTPNAPAVTVQLSSAALSVAASPPSARQTGGAQPPAGAIVPAPAPSPLGDQGPPVSQAGGPTLATQGATAKPVDSALPLLASQVDRMLQVPTAAQPLNRGTTPSAEANVSVVPTPSSPQTTAGIVPLRTAGFYPPSTPVAGAPPPIQVTSSPPSTVSVPVGGAAAIASLHENPRTPPPPLQAAPTPVPPPPQPSTPEAALAQAVQRSVSTQDSLVSLTTALSSIAAKVALPEPVLRAAQQVLAHRLPLDSGKLDGAALQRAVQQSGLFQEARLGAGQVASASTDLKTALLGLRRTLGDWLGSQAAVEPVAALPPPVRGLPPRVRVRELPAADVPQDPEEAGKVLLGRTEAALARLRLHQNASLPEQAQQQEGLWSLDLTVVVSGQQHLLQMQIHRDPEHAAPSSEERGWQVRFAMNLGDAGEIGAQISLRNATTGVMIWTESPDTAAALNHDLPELRQDLLAAGLNPGSVLVRANAPLETASVPMRHVVDETR